MDKPTKLTVGIGTAGVVCALAGLVAPSSLGWGHEAAYHIGQPR